MEPKIWGPSAWIFLHSVTLNYPNNPTPQDKEDYRIFFDSLQHILPCPTCKEHYAKNIRSNPINLKDRTSLINWLIDIHNQVNIYNSKPKLSYQEVYDIYDKLYNQNNVLNLNDNKIKICIVVLILTIIGIFLYLRK